MTIDHEIKDYSYVRNKVSPYQSLFTNAEFERMLSLCKRVFHKEYTNGTSVRLDSCTDIDGTTVLSVSCVGFFDFVTSNLALFSKDALLAEANGSERELVLRLAEKYAMDGSALNLASLLSRSYLANTLALSCLFIDSRSRILITHRNSTVGISNNFYSTTVTGSVDAADLDADDPLKQCCIRESCEELSFQVAPENIRIHSVVAGANKRQPIVLADVSVENIDEVVCALRSSKGFLEENNSFYITDVNGLAGFLSDSSAMITEAARTHLEGALKR